MFVLVVDTSLMNVSISAVVRDLDTTGSAVQSAIALEDRATDTRNPVALQPADRRSGDRAEYRRSAILGGWGRPRITPLA